MVTMMQFKTVPLRLLVLLLLSVSAAVGQGAVSNEKLLDKGYKAMVATHYEEAGRLFEKAAESIEAPLKYDALYKAALSWTLLGDSASLQHGAELLKRSLIEAEPEEPIYHKLLLLQAWNSAVSGDRELSKQQLAAAELYLPPDEFPRALWICKEVMEHFSDRFAADSCEKKLRERYPNSLEIRFTSLRGVAAAPSTPSAKSETGVAITRPGTTPASSAAAQPASTPSSASGEWALQLGAFSEKANAEAIAAQMAHLPKGVTIIPTKINNRTLYLVRILSFQTKEAAEAYRAQHLTPGGIEAQIRFVR